MAVMIDSIAHRYKILPSHVIAQGTTLDLYVMDLALSYRAHQERKAQNIPEQYSTEELAKMMAATRG